MIVTVPTLRNQMKNPKKNLGRQQGPEEKQISLELHLPQIKVRLSLKMRGKPPLGKRRCTSTELGKYIIHFFGGILYVFVSGGVLSKKTSNLGPSFFFRGIKWLLKVSARGGSGVSQPKKGWTTGPT